MSRYTNHFHIQILPDTTTRIFFRLQRSPIAGTDIMPPAPELQADVTMLRETAVALRDKLSELIDTTEPGTRQ